MGIRRGEQEDLTDRQQGLIGYLILIQSASKLGQMDCLLAGRLTAREALACDATPARPLDIRVHQPTFHINSFDRSFAPVASFVTVRTLFTLAVVCMYTKRTVYA